MSNNTWQNVEVGDSTHQVWYTDCATLSPEEIVNAGINIVPIDIATGVQNKLIDCIFLGSNCFTLKKLIRPIGISLPNNIYSFYTLNELGEAVLSFANNFENLENKTKFALNYNFGLDSFKNRLEDYINEANSYYKNRSIR